MMIRTSKMKNLFKNFYSEKVKSLLIQKKKTRKLKRFLKNENRNSYWVNEPKKEMINKIRARQVRVKEKKTMQN